MLLPNLDSFVSLFGGQVIAAVYAAARKEEDGLCNGQTLRGLPNLLLTAPDGQKFSLSGIVCTKNGWSWIQYATPVSPADKAKGMTSNEYGIVPFDWKSVEGTDPRVDAMRGFMREVVIRMDHDAAKHWEEKPAARPAKQNRAPSGAVLASLGL